MILSVQNTSLGESGDVADRVAQQTLAKRGAEYATEVRRLLDAALEVMQARGTTSRPRVADIVAAAGLSNDAFYRHFASKDALVAALLEDGTQRLVGYVDHQMSKESTPDDKVRAWVTGVLSQTIGETAAATLAVMWNGGPIGHGPASGRQFASAPLGELLHEPLAQLGSASPELDASLCAHAVFGKLADYLWDRSQPTDAERERIVAFCLGLSSANVSQGVQQ
jgi:AcrR family transcriptional regulator